jgi:hypothetical protein
MNTKQNLIDAIRIIEKAQRDTSRRDPITGCAKVPGSGSTRLVDTEHYLRAQLLNLR